MNKNPRHFCVIIAGGTGRRLWPASRAGMPKQFIDFFGTGRTLLQSTFDRFERLLPRENIYVCTAKAYQPLVEQQLPQLDKDHIMAEPVNRNTAPCTAWAGRRIHLSCDDACIVVTPSDQVIVNEEAFAADVLHGLDFVDERNLTLTLGIKPTRPEPGYGYIQVGEPTVSDGVHRVKSFTEKPEREFARMFMESGEFFWNTGLFITNANNLRDTMHKVMPDMPYRISDITREMSRQEELQFIEAHFPSYPNVSMDKAILEMSDNVYVMKCNFGWADLGTWHGIYESRQKWEGDNVVVDSQVMLDECRSCIVKLPKERLGVIHGLEGYIVAEQGNVLFICKKEDSSQLVRKYVNEVGLRFGQDFI